MAWLKEVGLLHMGLRAAANTAAWGKQAGCLTSAGAFSCV